MNSVLKIAFAVSCLNQIIAMHPKSEDCEEICALCLLQQAHKACADGTADAQTMWAWEPMLKQFGFSVGSTDCAVSFAQCLLDAMLLKVWGIAREVDLLQTVRWRVFPRDR